MFFENLKKVNKVQSIIKKNRLLQRDFKEKEKIQKVALFIKNKKDNMIVNSKLYGISTQDITRQIKNIINEIRKENDLINYNCLYTNNKKDKNYNFIYNF